MFLRQFVAFLVIARASSAPVKEVANKSIPAVVSRDMENPEEGSETADANENRAGLEEESPPEYAYIPTSILDINRELVAQQAKAPVEDELQGKNETEIAPQKIQAQEAQTPTEQGGPFLPPQSAKINVEIDIPIATSRAMLRHSGLQQVSNTHEDMVEESSPDIFTSKSHATPLGNSTQFIVANASTAEQSANATTNEQEESMVPSGSEKGDILDGLADIANKENLTSNDVKEVEADLETGAPTDEADQNGSTNATAVDQEPKNDDDHEGEEDAEIKNEDEEGDTDGGAGDHDDDEAGGSDGLELVVTNEVGDDSIIPLNLAGDEVGEEEQASGESSEKDESSEGKEVQSASLNVQASTEDKDATPSAEVGKAEEGLKTDSNDVLGDGHQGPRNETGGSEGSKEGEHGEANDNAVSQEAQDPAHERSSDEVQSHEAFVEEAEESKPADDEAAEAEEQDHAVKSEESGEAEDVSDAQENTEEAGSAAGQKLDGSGGDSEMANEVETSEKSTENDEEERETQADHGDDSQAAKENESGQIDSEKEAEIGKDDEESEMPKDDEKAEIGKDDEEAETPKDNEEAEASKEDEEAEKPKDDEEAETPKSDEEAEAVKEDEEAESGKGDEEAEKPKDDEETETPKEAETDNDDEEAEPAQDHEDVGDDGEDFLDIETEGDYSYRNRAFQDKNEQENVPANRHILDVGRGSVALDSNIAPSKMDFHGKSKRVSQRINKSLVPPILELKSTTRNYHNVMSANRAIGKKVNDSDLWAKYGNLKPKIWNPGEVSFLLPKSPKKKDYSIHIIDVINAVS